ncbi:hypothetical protein SAMN05216215_107043 [Saccharopolyspora shandongensis]|uniref:Secreted protein n=1 Tax=Saccharopolyspora shandongensis TaxID=418495 RepID=A0A1H3SV73_9PSEU|nr:hypothetical protein [Saccharopolyspora shandongensis]SDZ41431.1 hypothetical protein SAMN05216215_107043 [Saccharopolyspora shandongensis]
MKRAVAYVGVWLAATTAAVTLSWLGVRDIIRGAVFEPPDAIPVVQPVTTAPPPPPTESRPEPTPTTVDAPPPPPTSTPSPSRTADSGDVRTYDAKGGKVVLSVHADGAKLVSATPRPGYTVQTWDQAVGWLRVEFTAGQHGSSVIATWHDHPTSVQTIEY